MSLLEQYEQEATHVSNFNLDDLLSAKPEFDGEEIAIKAREPPIFKKHVVNYKPPDSITHLAVSNNQLVMALRNRKLLRIDMLHPDVTTEIELAKTFGERGNFAKLQQLFLDPTGFHCLLSFAINDTQTTYENLYLGPGKRAQQTSKLKGHLITAVGWNPLNADSSKTSNILVGTSKGLIFETELLASDETKWIQMSSTDQYWKQSFDVGPDTGAITGIQFHRISSDNVFFILVTTKNHFYQFVGSVASNAEPPFFHNIFSTYSGQFQDMPGNLGFSQLDVFQARNAPLPETFAWLTEPGVYYGKLDVTPVSMADNAVTSDAILIPYLSESNQSRSHYSREKPLAMVVTKFHVLILFENHMKAINVLNEQIVLEDRFTETFGSLKAITKDPVLGTIWVYTDQVIYRYKTTSEDRDIWQIYLSKRNFEMAKRFARKDPAKLDKVVVAEADYYFVEKDFPKSAELYAQSRKSFEETALKFLQLGNEEALKSYLACKLDAFSEKDVTQITLLVMWLLEIILDQMGNLRGRGLANSDEYQLLSSEFQSLMSERKIKACISRNSTKVQELISSHGDEENMVHFAREMGEYRVVLNHYVLRKQFARALEVLDDPNNIELIYEFAPRIIAEVPKPLVEVLIKHGNRLDATRLIPALLQASKGRHESELYNETVKYLEHCLYKLQVKGQVVHNYLLALYAQVNRNKLQSYLELKGDDESQINYDLKYVLRICTELGYTTACIRLYSTMGLYEEAVDLAIDHDIQLGKEIASMPESDELKRKLWLKIAKHVVLEEKDIRKVTDFLSECSLLKIEDILPYFPDFVTIDHFKDAICSSLQVYSSHIDGLKEEMKEVMENVDDIRKEVNELSNRHAVIRGDNVCVLCRAPVIARTFYVFPCLHFYHSDCLLVELRPHLRPEVRARVDEIENSLSSLRKAVKFQSSDNSTPDVGKETQQNSKFSKDRLATELDDIIGAECLMCGEIMIKSVDQPFISAEESYLASSGWD